MAKKKESGGAISAGTSAVSVNRKARHDYEILDTHEAGISLLGSEVKSLRSGEANLKESYVKLQNGEIFLVGCYIQPYSHSPDDAHRARRQRKLLMHRREIDRLAGELSKKGLTLIPLKLYFKDGRCKVQIGVAKGKKQHDKRQDEKTRSADRRIARAVGQIRKSR